MIEVRKAKKYYNRFKKNQVTAVDNTTLSFGDTGLVAILGNSGCGKTTLLNMIGGLDKPDSGKIFVNGKRMNSIFSGHTDNIRNRNIGYIFQNYHLIDDMTVFDNVALVLRMLGVRKKDQIKESVDYVLEKVGLYRYRHRPCTALSGGERQRVGIARAIVKINNLFDGPGLLYRHHHGALLPYRIVKADGQMAFLFIQIAAKYGQHAYRTHGNSLGAPAESPGSGKNLQCPGNRLIVVQRLPPNPQLFFS